MISDENLIIASNNKSVQPLQNALPKEENISFIQAIHFEEQNDSNLNHEVKKIQVLNGQHQLDSFSQRLILLDQENNQQKLNDQINYSNNTGKIQDKRHLSYIKMRTGRNSDDDLPINQLRHQSILRKVFNKVKISLQVKTFIYKIMSLAQIQKYKVFNEDPIFFNLINDKAAYQNKQLFQTKIVGQNGDKRKEIKSRIIIAQNYLKNQFLLDAITLASVSIFFSLQFNPRYEEYSNILNVCSVGSIFQEMNKSSKQRKNNLFVINNYMKKKKITSELQYQIRHYLEYYWNESLSENSQEESNIINQLSNNLKENLMIEANKILVAESPFFRDNFSFKTILKTVSLVQEQRCTPEEIIYLEGDLEDCSIYFIEKGSVQIFRDHTNESILFKKEFMECNTLKAGQYFGEISFYTGMQRRFCVRSLEFTTLIKIERAKFIETVKEVPSDYEKFCQIKDDIIFNNNYKHSMKKCTYCQNIQNEKAYHFQIECPIVHYIPNNSRLLDQFKYNSQLTQTERGVTKRQSQKHNNTLGRIEQVKGYQSRLAFQEESIIFAYIQTYGIEDFTKNNEQSDNSISKSGFTLSSNSIEEENNDSQLRQKPIENNQIISQYSDSDEFLNEEDSVQSLSSPEKEIRFQNYIQNTKINKKPKISKQISKSLVIEEDQHELESNQQKLTMITQQNLKLQDKTDELITNFDVEEQPSDLKQTYIQEKITNHSIIMNNFMPFTKQICEKNLPLKQNKSVNSEFSLKKIFLDDQKCQFQSQEQDSASPDLQQCEGNKNRIENQYSSDQSIQAGLKFESQSSNLINISPYKQIQKPKSSILQSVKFKLPNKKLYMKNKSLQDIRLLKDYDNKGIQKIKSNSTQQIHLTNSSPDKKQLLPNQKQKQNSPLKAYLHLTEKQKQLSAQQKKNIHKLKRFSSSGYVISDKELFQNSTSENIIQPQASQKQLQINNFLQQRLSTQLDNLTINFQKIQEILINQTHTQNLNYNTKISLQQNTNNNSSMKEFDKMKIFEIYFPHNNYDEVIFLQNHLQFNKASKIKLKNALAFSPSRRLQLKNCISQQNNSNSKVQVIKEMLSINTLNRLKYLKNEKNKKNSITDQLFLSQLSLGRRCDTNISLPVEKTDQMSPCSNQNFFTQTNQDEEVHRGGYFKQQQYNRKCSIEIGSQLINQHNLIIPNYFGLQQKQDSQSSFQGKKSRFSNRNSIFKNEQMSGDNSNNSNEKITDKQNNS
ncbi:hypothetical protein ABPG74_005814 [Tetrahymena malaccensis]